VRVYVRPAIVNVYAGEIGAEGNRAHCGFERGRDSNQAGTGADHSLSVTLHVPGHAQARRKVSVIAVKHGRDRRARAYLLHRWRGQEIDIGIEGADVVIALNWWCGVVVSDAEVQRDSGGDAPIVLDEARIPVAPNVCLRIAQEDRSTSRLALQEAFQGAEVGYALGSGKRVPVKNDVYIVEAKLKGVFAP